MFVLTFLVYIHMAYSFIFEEATEPDFDEVFEAEGGPDMIKKFELKRLPRKAGDVGLDTEVLLVENGKNIIDKAEFNDLTKDQKISRALVFHNVKKVGAALSTRNPFLVSRDYMSDRDLIHMPNSLVDINLNFKIITPLATPYTRSLWEPNFQRYSSEE